MATKSKMVIILPRGTLQVLTTETLNEWLVEFEKLPIGMIVRGDDVEYTCMFQDDVVPLHGFEAACKWFIARMTDVYYRVFSEDYPIRDRVVDQIAVNDQQVMFRTWSGAVSYVQESAFCDPCSELHRTTIENYLFKYTN